MTANSPALGVNSGFAFPFVPHFIGNVPKKPRAILIEFDATNFVNNVFSLDLSLYQAMAEIEFIQSVYIDNQSGGAGTSLRLHCEVSEMHVVILGQRQGWFPLIVPNPPKFHIHAAAPAQTNVFFTNIWVPSASVWPTA